MTPTYNESIAAHGMFLRELKRLGSPTGMELTEALDASADLARMHDESFDFIHRADATSYELIDTFFRWGFVEAVSFYGGLRPVLSWEWNRARIRITDRGLRHLSIIESEAAEEMKLFDDPSPAST